MLKLTPVRAGAIWVLLTVLAALAVIAISAGANYLMLQCFETVVYATVEQR